MCAAVAAVAAAALAEVGLDLFDQVAGQPDACSIALENMPFAISARCASMCP